MSARKNSVILSYVALVVQRIEPLTPKEKMGVQFFPRALKKDRARSIEVTRDYGIVESGVQFPAGPQRRGSSGSRAQL